MLSSLRERVGGALAAYPALLAAAGVVDREKGAEAFDLAVPVMVTGGMRTLLRITDFLMVGLYAGGTAIAALEFGFQYYFIVFGLALALTSGTISVVSRLKGAGDDREADFAIKQSLWIALAVSIPATLFAHFFAEELIGVLSNDARTVALGGAYLRIVMYSAAFRFWSMIAARALAGSGDTRTPMYVRLLTLPTNVALNAALIFGLGALPELGIRGAAWGTTAANALAAAVFAGALLSGRYSVRLPLGGKQWDTDLARELVRVSLPLAGTRLSRTLGRFPFLFVLGVLGTEVVAAYAIGRRVMLLALMPAWGYSTAASTLVGQSLGGGDDAEADAYGWQTLRLALVTQLLIGAALFVVARPVAAAFNPGDLDLTVTFVRVFGLGVAGFSVARTMRGALRGAGDTRWPLYGGLVGTYVVRLPIAVLALPAGYALTLFAGPLGSALGLAPTTVGLPGMDLGLLAVFAAIVADMYVRGVVNLARYWSDEWKTVAGRADVGSTGD
ncbi:MATE family efflux transporter [Candidatus Halobonum tyrrellensis]|uniref:Multidrug-efflux transporter n=1 Tax=Candidatus Halobonum tyrrellensis G22 TaxID=1324957 RepID=V4IXN4_9EURY|nr:MATE family efflux transporter [Candidatus Halobonum tyrrellensis]ESP87922.1 efflux protein, mate family [Candidatus Halobonum tyrrellensis G22]